MALMIAGFLFLLFMSAFFSGSETAIFSLDILKRTRIFKEKNRAAARLRMLSRHPQDLLKTILIGNMLVNIAFSSLSSEMFGDAHFLAVASITMALLIFGEVTPKNIAYVYNKQLAKHNSLLLTFFFHLFSPFRKLLQFITRPLVERYSEALGKRALLTTDEIKTAVAHGQREGVLGEDETDLISNVLNFSMKDARHIMTPRTRMKALSQDATLKEAVAFVREHAVSKIPLYKKNKDTITGYLRVKDLLPYIRGLKKATGISHLTHPVFYIPEGKGLADFCTELKESTSRLAVVVDEYGGTAGIITLDDVLEEVMGQFLDEDEQARRFFWKTVDGAYVFRGSAPLEVFNDELTMNLVSPDYETLSGYLLELAGDIPQEGDQFEDIALIYRIKKMEENHISLIEIERKP